MKRKLWQFRLRSLFVLLLLSALAAAWWSHRRHCLERAEFHERQAKSDIDEAEGSALANFEYSLKLMNDQYKLAMEQAKEAEQVYQEALNRAKASLPDSMLQDVLQDAMQKRYADHDFFDEKIPERTRIERAISSGYLLAPVAGAPRPRSNPSAPAPQQPEPPAAVEEVPEPLPPANISLPPPPEQTVFERRAKALHERSEFHEQQHQHYRRAVYRPWINLQEPPPPE
ncbi:MAG: hypothetical protein IAF94_15355, partial [Pirellulaceae bacterium]|nr:hypothetical protein [Pirellulaceae bacterium]